MKGDEDEHGREDRQRGTYKAAVGEGKLIGVVSVVSFIVIFTSCKMHHLYTMYSACIKVFLAAAIVRCVERGLCGMTQTSTTAARKDARGSVAASHQPQHHGGAKTVDATKAVAPAVTAAVAAASRATRGAAPASSVCQSGLVDMGGGGRLLSL